MTTYDDDLATIDAIIKKTRFATVTTRTATGALVSRPLAVLEHDFDGDVWFFTAHPSPKTDDIAHDAHVNVAYVDGQSVVSLSGTARVEHDRALIDQWWNPWVEAWFPDGKDDPSVALLKVEASTAEYWHIDKPGVLRAIEIVKAIVTRTTPDVGDNRTVEL